MMTLVLTVGETAAEICPPMPAVLHELISAASSLAPWSVPRLNCVVPFAPLVSACNDTPLRMTVCVVTMFANASVNGPVACADTAGEMSLDLLTAVAK